MHSTTTHTYKHYTYAHRHTHIYTGLHDRAHDNTRTHARTHAHKMPSAATRSAPRAVFVACINKVDDHPRVRIRVS